MDNANHQARNKNKERWEKRATILDAVYQEKKARETCN